MSAQTKIPAKAPAKVAPFVMTRSFDAPRETVFAAFTDPEHLRHWWGPKGTAIGAVKMDLRVGGMFHYCMRAPNGAEMWGRFVYRVIEPPARLVWVSSFSDPDGGVTRPPAAEQWPLYLLTTLTFEDLGATTRLTLDFAPLAADDEECAVFDTNRDGLRGGWTGTFDKLDAYLAKARS